MASSNLAVWLGIVYVLYSAPAVAPSLTESVPLHVAVSWAIFIFFAATWKGYFRPTRDLDKVEIIAFLLPIVIMSYYKFATANADDYWGIRVYWILTGIILAISASAVFSQERSRNIFLKLSIFGAFVTAFVSILQYFNVHSFFWSWTRFSELGLVYGTAGLDNNTVKFGYSIVGIATIVGCSLIAYLRKIKLMPLSKMSIFLVSFVIFSGILVSGSRSAILGIALGTLWFAWYIAKSSVLAYSREIDNKTIRPEGISNFSMKTKINDGYLPGSTANPALQLKPPSSNSNKQNNKILRAQIIFLSFIFASVFILIAVGTREGVEDDARFSDTWVAYVPVIAANIFGNSVDLSQNIHLMDADALYNLTSQNRRMDPIWPHNIILTTGLTIGLPGIISLALIYWIPISRALRAANRANTQGMYYEGAWLAALIAGNIGVLTHCWYHNGNILLGEMRNWIWIGALWGLTFFVNSLLKKL